MGAPQSVSDHNMPKSCFGKRILKECTSRKRDNIVLIEVDTDDISEVIILDVPESFQNKFRKKPKRVIRIDDDDGGVGGGGSKDGACHSHSDATSSSRNFPTEAADPSTSCNANDNCNEGNTPVKLSKSKRTYSGKTIPKNRYGLGPDSEGGYSSESDCSDCEFMGGSSNKLREQWEKASSRRRRYASTAPHNFDSEAGTSAPRHPVHDNADPPGHQSNGRNCSLREDGGDVYVGSSKKFSNESKSLGKDYDPIEMDEQISRKCDDYINSSSDDKARGGSLTPESPVHHTAEHSTVKISDSASGFRPSAGKNAEDLKFPEQGCDANMTNEVLSTDYSAAVTKGPSQNFMSDHVALFDGQQGAEIVSMQPDHKVSCGDEVVSSDQNNIITDRQKIKETDLYKHAMEEQQAAMQQQVLIQAEEARRLRCRKKAENMRIMMNEKRQKQRVEEIRQTRRKDEEKLNLKEKHRMEIKKELHRIEAICGDMASLLRCLGIHVGGGLHPSPNEVQTAYKRACLKFHPDRMSTTDLRQQVESEEKFKLISNMKDKFWQNR